MFCHLDQHLYRQLPRLKINQTRELADFASLLLSLVCMIVCKNYTVALLRVYFHPLQGLHRLDHRSVSYQCYYYGFC
jgi:hypothetical protein